MSSATSRQPRAGLLPLYLELYDQTMPAWRGTLAPFVEEVAAALAAQGLEVVRSGICRLAGEFEAAVAAFERAEADCIVTLHLAYSPSLEAADALVRSRLPILMLDTTMDRDFGPGADPARIAFNHGVHGVMDLASVLRRHGKPFRIVAGHAGEPALWERSAAAVRAAHAARSFRSTKALRVGETFKGMGDFQVEEGLLRRKLGIAVEEIAARELVAEAGRLAAEEIEAEMANDRRRYECAGLSPEAHRRSVRAGLALRKRLEAGGFDAFSLHFGAFAEAGEALGTVPFLEASKAMARGIGYAGEGDVLTAALVGALQRAFGRTTFTEIFCPDWAGGALFLSHMGEVNPEVAAGRPALVEKELAFTGTKPPVILTCAPARGPAVFVNLAPGPADAFSLIAAPVEVLGDAERPDMKKSVRGWVRPERPLPEFLEAYSRAGGTHHSALVLGQSAEAMESFAVFAGLGFERL